MSSNLTTILNWYCYWVGGKPNGNAVAALTQMAKALYLTQQNNPLGLNSTVSDYAANKYGSVSQPGGTFCVLTDGPYTQSFCNTAKFVTVGPSSASYGCGLSNCGPENFPTVYQSVLAFAAQVQSFPILLSLIKRDLPPSQWGPDGQNSLLAKELTNRGDSYNGASWIATSEEGRLINWFSWLAAVAKPTPTKPTPTQPGGGSSVPDGAFVVVPGGPAIYRFHSGALWHVTPAAWANPCSSPHSQLRQVPASFVSSHAVAGVWDVRGGVCGYFTSASTSPVTPTSPVSTPVTPTSPAQPSGTWVDGGNYVSSAVYPTGAVYRYASGGLWHIQDAAVLKSCPGTGSTALTNAQFSSVPMLGTLEFVNGKCTYVQSSSSGTSGSSGGTGSDDKVILIGALAAAALGVGAYALTRHHGQPVPAAPAATAAPVG